MFQSVQERYNIVKTTNGINICDKSTNDVVAKCVLNIKHDHDDIYKHDNIHPFDKWNTYNCFTDQNIDYINKNIVLFENDNQSCILFHDYENGNFMFPVIKIVNLETQKQIEFDPALKTGYKKVFIDSKSKIIIFRGYVCGMIDGYLFFDFDGEELCWEEIVKEKSNVVENIISIPYHFEQIDGTIYINVCLKKEYLEYLNDGKIETNFELKNFTLMENPKEKNIFMIKCFDFTNNTNVIDPTEIAKIIDFQKKSKKYQWVELIKAKMKKNDKNIFKVFSEMALLNIETPSNVSISNFDNNDNLLINEFLNCDDIVDFELNDLYSGDNYDGHWDFFQKNNFSEHKFDNFKNFGCWLANQIFCSLGSTYYQDGPLAKSVEKTLLPNGIGLIFKIAMANKYEYKFIIKMSLIEHPTNPDYLKYDEEKSLIDIDISLSPMKTNDNV